MSPSGNASIQLHNSRQRRSDRLPHPKHRLGIAVLLAGIALHFAAAAGAAAGAAADATEPWLSGPFAADPAALLKAAARIEAEPDAEVVMLLDERQLSFESDGREISKVRQVFQIVDAAAIDSWSTTEAYWKTGHQDRPEIRGRVIVPGGAAYTLDPRTIDDSPADDVSDDLFQDWRLLRAPMPQLVVGAIVETETVTRDRKAIFPAGVLDTTAVGQPVPVRTWRLTIDAPEGSTLTHRLHGVDHPIDLVEEVVGGRRYLRFEARGLKAMKPPEPLLPAEVPRWPHLSVTTGSSWQEVARAYHELVEDQLAGVDMRELASELVGDERAAAKLVELFVAYIHRTVRYTGVEFGASSIVPATPSATLERAFGDCKDQALLLVALLRARGVEAHLALLRTGPDSQVDTDLPGIGGFDHAIVHIAGEPPLWADPTARFVTGGALPIQDQDRLALVARAASESLVRTPVASSKENLSRETRIIQMAEMGGGRVLETAEFFGSSAASQRSYYGENSFDDLYTSISQYTDHMFLARGIDRFQFADPARDDDPFWIVVETCDSRRIATDETTAVVAIPIAGMFDGLPYVLRQPLEAEGETMPSPATPVEPRKHDYALLNPHTVEWDYRIVPPPGHVPTGLPSSARHRLGPAVFEEYYQVVEDGAVQASLRFDTISRRYTPTEALELRQGLAKLRLDEFRMIQFDNVARSHLDAGRLKEALHEYQGHVDRVPTSPFYRSQLAHAMGVAGLGESARQAARQAVESDPNSAHAHRTLGWILQHDLFGRRFQAGWDRDGSIVAYRRAMSLDPDDHVAMADLAIVLETAPDGARYAEGAELEASNEIYRQLRKLGVNGFDLNLLINLAHLADFDAMIEFAREMAPSPGRDIWLLVAHMARGGEAEMSEVGRRLRDTGDGRRELFAGAAMLALGLRRFDDSASLMAAAAAGAVDLTERAQFITTMKAASQVQKQRPEGAVGFVQEIMRKLLTRPSAEVLARVIGAKEGEEVRGFRTIKRMLETSADLNGIPLDVSLDLWFAASVFSVDGDDQTGYRVRVRTTGPRLQQALFVKSGPEGFRLFVDHAAIAAEALALAEAGKLTAAHRWLDWLREEIQPLGGDDPLVSPPFAQLWSRSGERGSERTMLAAATLLTRDDAERAISILEGGAESLEPGGRSAVDAALASAYAGRKRWDDLSRAADRLMTAFPESFVAFTLASLALIEQEQPEKARALSETRLVRLPDDLEAIRFLARLDAIAGDHASARRRLRGIVDAGRAEAQDYNELAWSGVLADAVDATVLAEAIAAVQMSRGLSYAELHTLATVYAESGSTGEAHTTLLKAMNLRDDNEPQSADWYILGRLAEHYGLPDASRNAYSKVEPAEGNAQRQLSTHLLAQRRLRLLNGPPREGRGR